MEVEFFVEASSFLSMGRGILVNLNNLLIVVFLWPRCDSWKWDYSDGGFFTIHSCLGGCVWCPLVVELKDHLFCVVILQGGFGFPFLGGLVCLRPYLEMCSHF